MVNHPLVEQLRFARSEFQRGLVDLSDEDAQVRLGPINSIGWVIGHFAWQEQRYFVTFATGATIDPDLPARFGTDSPPTIPTLTKAWRSWTSVTATADRYLDTLTADALGNPAPHDTRPKDARPTVGTMLLRTTYHYWYHLGETQAIRQSLGHQNLALFVGDIDGEAPYRPA